VTVADLVGWVLVALMLLLCLTQWVGFDALRPVAVLQAFTPWLLGAAIPLWIVATASARWALAGACVPAMVTFVLLAKQVPAAEEWPDGATTDFTIAFGNLLSENRVQGDVVQAMADSAADVLVLVEFTPWMRDTLHAICGDRYPHRFDAPLPNPAGIGVWSSLPFERAQLLTTVDRPTIDVDLHTGAGTVRLLALHTITPTLDAPGWVAEIVALGAVAAGPSPTVIVGDFNAARWHPTFRSLLAAGWRSAHESVGQGWSPSWPAAHYPLPMFVRLDHALARGLIAIDVHDIELPGSDHRGFVAGFSVSADRVSGWHNRAS